MPAARDEAPIPTNPCSRTITRPMPAAAANTDAQPPMVPAPTTTRSARSVNSRLLQSRAQDRALRPPARGPDRLVAPGSSVERGGLNAGRDDPETTEALG